MNSYDRDEWKTCRECRTPMVPLRDFEISSASEGATFDSDPIQFLLFGWWSFVYNFVFSAGRFAGRKKRLQELKSENLTQFPHSLVCPRCLEVEKRA